MRCTHAINTQLAFNTHHICKSSDVLFKGVWKRRVEEKPTGKTTALVVDAVRLLVRTTNFSSDLEFECVCMLCEYVSLSVCVREREKKKKKKKKKKREREREREK
jgi:hypothetical protein